MSAIESPKLRPMSLGQLLDRSFRLYRQNFLTFVGIIAAMVIPVYGIYLVFSLLNIPRMLEAMENLTNMSSLDDPMQLFTTQMQAMGGGNSLLLSALSFFLIQGVATAALVKAIEDSYLDKPGDILGSYGKIAGKWLPLLVALLLGFLLIILLLVWTIIPCIGWLTGLGILAFVSYVIYPMVPVTVVVENRRGFGAIRRAWELARRRFWWVLGYMFLLYILAYVITVGPSFLLGIALGYLQETVMSGFDMATQMAIQTSLSQVITMVMQIIYLPIQLTAIVVMYFDLRVRTEGFDLAMLAAEAEAGDSSEAAPIIPQAPAAEQTPLVTGTEILYFLGINVGIGALCGILYGVLAIVGIALTAVMMGL
ncbi:MAG: hypothetical protein JXB30_03760 [Anaerolineae bacterium]|nr:hypothetical protein [Anaerolineae bacterium]